MEDLLTYIAQCPTAFHTVAHSGSVLETAGYTPLYEHTPWTLEKGGKYYVTRNGSSLIAFRVGTDAPTGFMMAAAHGDSPCFKLNESPEMAGPDGTVRLSVEKYGGSIHASWLDRPLSVAGRVMVRTGNGVSARLIDLREPCAIIPHVAIHMDRQMNDKNTLNAAVDMVPLYAPGADVPSLASRVAAAAGAATEDILGSDLFIYNPQRGESWNGLITAPRLDDLHCAYAALRAFLDAGDNASAIPVCCIFDNEEVGSQTKQGAASTFLRDVLVHICVCLGLDDTDLPRLLRGSFLASCDNAQGHHPNHPELADPRHAPVLGKGVVIKHNAAQHYTTDAVSDALFRLLCERAGVPVQHYNNRADMPGGSTLGNIANTQVSLNTVDIGCAQLAMHSAYETAAAADTDYMVRALKALFAAALEADGDGSYRFL